MTLSNNKYINTKKIIDNNFYDNKISDSNLSISNLFSGNNLNFSFGNLDINSENIFSNFNNFEEGREFVQKKYLFSINQSSIVASRSLNSLPSIQKLGSNKSSDYFLIANKDLFDYLLSSNGYMVSRGRNFDKHINAYSPSVLGSKDADFIMDSAFNFSMFNSYIGNLDNLSSTDSYICNYYADQKNTYKF